MEKKIKGRKKKVNLSGIMIQEASSRYNAINALACTIRENFFSA
jgi:hypothetical protein